MKIAIHSTPDTFSDEWIRYCKLHGIDFKQVNCYDSDIINQLGDCDGLMWHWSQTDSKAILFARQLTYSLERIGKKTYPDSKTCWHFDDKVGQKYLLEAIKAPLAPSYVFYDKREAREWIRKAALPVVFKLRVGASSVNVKLVQTRRVANRLIGKSFRHGFNPLNRVNMLSDKIMRFNKDSTFSNFLYIVKALVRFIFPRHNDRMLVKEKGYVYFQEFIPENKYDIRLVVIGDRAFGMKRMVRKNDFRASGSGNIVFKPEEIPSECIRTSFNMAEKLEMQSVSFDIVFKENKMFVLEISYGFVASGYKTCPGYWDKDLGWHEEPFIPEWFIIEDFISSLS